MPAFPKSLTFRDAKNQTSTMHYFAGAADAATAATAALSIEGAVAPLTNATVRSGDNSALAPQAGTAAALEDVEDKANFVFQSTFGSIHRYSVAAPKLSIFLADEETIDYTNADVAAFVTAFTGAAATRDGQGLSSVGGSRDRVRLQRKFNVRTRNPTLTGQGL